MDTAKKICKVILETSSNLSRAENIDITVMEEFENSKDPLVPELIEIAFYVQLLARGWRSQFSRANTATVKKLKVEVDGITTNIRKFTYKKGVNICPLCRKQIESGDETYLLINNYKLFPNVVIHTKCVDLTPIMNSIPIIDWKDTIKKLKKDYEQAEQSRKHNACWFE